MPLSATVSLAMKAKLRSENEFLLQKMTVDSIRKFFSVKKLYGNQSVNLHCKLIDWLLYDKRFY